MEQRKVLSVLIPALNEESGIAQTIGAIPKEELIEKGYDLEIIVIDGNSTDLTREVAQSNGAKVIVENRKGYGRAYKTAFREAKGDIIVTLDGDGTYPAELIPEYLLQLNQKGLDFITINRFSNMEYEAMPFSHKIGNRILSISMLLLFALEVKDSQSGMWLMTRKFLDSIKIESDDFSMSEEIKIIAFTYFNALELEGKYYRRSGKVKLVTFRDGWSNLRYLFKYRTLLKYAIQSPLISIQRQSH